MSAGAKRGLTGLARAGGRSGVRPLGLNAVEAGAALLSLAMLVAAIAYYWASLRPVQEQLKAVQAEYEQQRKWIMEKSAPDKQEQQSPAERAKAMLASLDTFRDDRLTSFSSGRIALINEINALIKKDGLQLTSGIALSTVAAAQEQAAEAKSGKKSAKKKAGDLETVYPGLVVHATVFGQYPNIKEFIADLERNKQFLLINTIGLVNQEPKTNSGRHSRSASMGAGIALTIELRAYFKPEGA
jgi:hypothetical protein